MYKIYIFLLEVITATNLIWKEISSHRKWHISKKAIHSFVYPKWHGIKEKLGITTNKIISIKIKLLFALHGTGIKKKN